MSEILTSGRVDTSLLRESAVNDLVRLLNKCNGPKVIVLDEGLMRPINLIVKHDVLEKHGVKDMLILNPGKLSDFHAEVQNVIFFTRPFLPQMNMISENIHCCVINKGNKRKLLQYHLFFIPTRSLVCESHLEKNGVLKNFVCIEELRLFLFPLENDLLSMEMNDSFKELSLENDQTCLYQVAQAIVMLEDIYGRIDRVSGKGHAVKQVWDLVSKISLEQRRPDSKANRNFSTIDNLILIDRSVDLLTPMVTQLTYEGLIDELFGIDFCTVKLPVNEFIAEENVGDFSTTKTIELTSREELFAETRDKHFNAALLNLNERARNINLEYTEKRKRQSLGGLKHLFSRLPYIMQLKKQLSTYTTIAGLIKELTDKSSFRHIVHIQQEIISGNDSDKVLPQIEDLISNEFDFITVLRLICLQSAVNSGLKQKVLGHYKKELIQTYGFQHLLTLTYLEKSGLIKQQASWKSYANYRQSLRLVGETSEVDPDDIHYVHGTYAPLSVRLVQHLSKSDSKILADVLPFIPGPTVEYVNPNVDQSSNMKFLVDSNKVVLVFFVGGCTFSEIAALRFLYLHEESSFEYIIATTNITNGNKLIKSLLIPEIEKSLNR